MMGYSDAFHRMIMRILSKHTTLYTEMLVANAAIRLSDEKLHMYYGYGNDDNRTILQLGGSEPSTVAHAGKRLHELLGVKRFNLNCGCPSDPVQAGDFGGRLMLKPSLVAEIVSRFAQLNPKCSISVKCRIGIDSNDSAEFLFNFIKPIAATAVVDHFVIHARKALLNGVSPKDNRSIPPLNYSRVYEAVKEFPSLCFTLNGEIRSLDDAKLHLQKGVHGIMMGRRPFKDPMLLASADEVLFRDAILTMPSSPSTSTVSAEAVIAQYIAILEELEGRCAKLKPFHMLRPLLNIFHGQPLAAAFTRELLNGRCSAVPSSRASEIAKRALEKLVKMRMILDSRTKDVV